MVKIGRVPGCKIRTGNYTGDGAATQAITGLGFRPKVVWVWQDAGGILYHFDAVDAFIAGTHFAYYNTLGYLYTSMFASMDADGFTVKKDTERTDHANAVGVTYTWLALG